jgi:hypothetical protein
VGEANCTVKVTLRDAFDNQLTSPADGLRAFLTGPLSVKDHKAAEVAAELQHNTSTAARGVYDLQYSVK